MNFAISVGGCPNFPSNKKTLDSQPTSMLVYIIFYTIHVQYMRKREKSEEERFQQPPFNKLSNRIKGQQRDVVEVAC